MFEHVCDARAQRRVGLDQPLAELPGEPGVKFRHCRAAVGLVKLQPRRWRQFPLPRDRVVAVDARQGFEHVTAFLRKMLRRRGVLPAELDDLPRYAPAMPVPAEAVTGFEGSWDEGDPIEAVCG